MPFGTFVNAFSPLFFDAVHVALFAVGGYFAYRSFQAGESSFGWGFTLYALGEVFYLSYHLDLTVFLFAHTVAGVLVAVGLVLIFSRAARIVLAGGTAEARP